jgi:hypothetical protein
VKIILQISTSTLGDMAIEETEDKTTTNREDQKAIIVELLAQALYKVTAAYDISKDMFDLGDAPYTSADERKYEEDRQPRYSSAAANRAVHNIEPTHTGHSSPQDRNECYCDRVSEEGEDELVLTEEELEFVKGIISVMRGKNAETN